MATRIGEDRLRALALPTARPEGRRPQLLALTNEPKANVERYDALRNPQGCVMRHDPPSAAIVIMLKSLKMHGKA